MLASLDFTLNLKSPKDRLFELITMYEKYPTFLPQQIREVKILENDFKKTITEETLYFKTFFEKENDKIELLTNQYIKKMSLNN